MVKNKAVKNPYEMYMTFEPLLFSVFDMILFSCFCINVTQVSVVGRVLCILVPLDLKLKDHLHSAAFMLFSMLKG